MGFPAEHFGSGRKRVWYKVKWMKSPPGLEVESRFDLLMKRDMEKYREFLKVLDRVETGECEAGLPVGLGKSEEEVDAWIERNRK
jgi:hypothetical protein